MKNLLICLALYTASSFTFADDALLACAIPAVEAENARVQLVLKTYAQIVHFYQSEIDGDTLQFLAIKSAELDAQLNAQLNATEDHANKMLAQRLAVNFLQ